MDCATAREAISALADGEDPGADPSTVDEHLAACGDCRRWQDAAHDVTRRARLGVAYPAATRTHDAVAAVPIPRWARPQGRLVILARLGLAGAAIGQLALTVPFLVAGHDHGAPQHVAHEMGALDAALGAGFLVAAWRPARALGMRTLVGVASVLLIVTAVIDLVAGRTSAGDEAPHLLAVAGWLMIRYLAVRTPPAAAARNARPGGFQRSWPAWLGWPTSRLTAADGAGWRPACLAHRPTLPVPGPVSTSAGVTAAAGPSDQVRGRIAADSVTDQTQDVA